MIKQEKKNTSLTRRKLIGYLMVLAAGLFWGIQGNVVKVLIEKYQFTSEWLVTIRTLFAGGLLLSFLLIKERAAVYKVWGAAGDRRQLLFFAVVGLLGVQYSFFAAIDFGNAAIATLLQYLAPLFVTVYFIIKYRRAPQGKEIVSIIFALLGLALLITNGNPGSLSISVWAVFWGLVSAVTLAYYTVYPVRLINKYGSLVIVGWGMLIAGLLLSWVAPPWRNSGVISAESMFLLAFVVLFGTLLSFTLYLSSLKFISPTHASLLTCVEPLSATIVAIMFMNVAFGFWMFVGGVLILAAIMVIISIGSSR